MSLVTPAAEGQPTTETAPLLEAVAEVAGKISPPRQPQPPRTSAIRQAIEEVGEIVEALKRVLDQMEEVLELAEMVERQKTADEQEIESLRRALRQLQRPGGNRHRGDGEPQS